MFGFFGCDIFMIILDYYRVMSLESMLSCDWSVASCELFREIAPIEISIILFLLFIIITFSKMVIDLY